VADLASRTAEFLLYQSEDGRTRVEVRFEGETAWLSLSQMSDLFQRDKSVISRHIKNVFEEGELDRASVVAESASTATDGKTYQVEYFNLDVIISVGYRVKSHRGTQFRIWATQRLREYIVKGFTLDDERLKRGSGGNYFDELLARIRDIRSSEKVFWRKVFDRALRNTADRRCREQHWSLSRVDASEVKAFVHDGRLRVTHISAASRISCALVSSEVVPIHAGNAPRSGPPRHPGKSGTVRRGLSASRGDRHTRPHRGD